MVHLDRTGQRPTKEQPQASEVEHRPEGAPDRQITPARVAVNHQRPVGVPVLGRALANQRLDAHHQADDQRQGHAGVQRPVRALDERLTEVPRATGERQEHLPAPERQAVDRVTVICHNVPLREAPGAHADEQATTRGGCTTTDPELRFQYLHRRRHLRVAVTQRIQQDGERRDGDTSFLRVNVWRGQAEHLADSLTKGDRVLVTGRLRQRSWEPPRARSGRWPRSRPMRSGPA
jgi:Single-strand binding protein family